MIPNIAIDKENDLLNVTANKFLNSPRLLKLTNKMNKSERQILEHILVPIDHFQFENKNCTVLISPLHKADLRWSNIFVSTPIRNSNITAMSLSSRKRKHILQEQNNNVKFIKSNDKVMIDKIPENVPINAETKENKNFGSNSNICTRSSTTNLKIEVLNVEGTIPDWRKRPFIRYDKIITRSASKKSKQQNDASENLNKALQISTKSEMDTYATNENREPKSSIVKANKTVDVNKRGKIKGCNKTRLNKKRVENDVVNNKTDTDLNSELIQNVLEEYYININDRFNFDFKTRCFNDQEFCRRNHTKDGIQKPKIADYYMETGGQIYISEIRYKSYLKYINDLILRKIFPGSNLLFEIFRIIWIYDDTDPLASNDFVLNECINIIDKVLYLFPPCWCNLKQHYSHLLTYSFEISSSIALQNGIFWFAIEQLEYLIDNDVKANTNTIDQNISSNDNFYNWEIRQKKKTELDKKTRDEKIDRLFLILNLLTSVLENDTSIIFTSKSLIQNLFWGETSTGEINIKVKRITLIFVKTVALKYPDDKIDILARILNLISNVMLSIELKTQEKLHDQLVFPVQSFNYTDSLIQELFKMVSDLKSHYQTNTTSKNRTMQFYYAILNKLRSIVMQMLFGDKILNKLDNTYKVRMSIEKFYSRLEHLKEWINESHDVNLTKTKTNKKNQKENRRSHKNENSIDVTENECESKYRVFYKTKPVKISAEEILVTDYLNIFFGTFKAYTQYYKLNSISKRLNILNTNPLKIKTKQKSNDINNINEKEKSEKKTFGKNISQGSVFDIQLVNKTKQSRVKIDKIVIDDSLIHKYKNDINYLKLLSNYIHGQDLPEFIDFVNYIEKEF